MKVIDKKYTAILTFELLLYFFGIAVYTLLPDFVNIPDQIIKVFYWVNNTLLLTTITLIFSKFVIDKRTALLLKGASVFFLVLGSFQIAVCFGCSFGILWVMFCPLYLIFTLIIYKLCHRRSL